MLQDAMFSVKEVPIFKDVVTHNLGTHDKNEKSGYKFIVREDNGQILSCMTDSYKLVKNETIMNIAEPLIKKLGGEPKAVNVLAGGAKTQFSWHFPKQVVKMSKTDEMTPEINIMNSYNGTVGLNILGGAFRLICLNGMIVGIVASKYKNKHIKSNISLNDISNVIEETVDKTKLVFKEEFPILAETKFQENDLIEMIKMFPDYANTLVTDKIIIDKPKTFWDLFNVGTNVLSHHMNRKLDSTHGLEQRLYPKIKKLAYTEAKIAIS